MHALTCYKFDIGDIVYCMLPTYYKPNQFIECKVHIDWIYHSEMSIFYHCTFVELVSDLPTSLKTLMTAKVRCINRQSGKLDCQFMPIRHTMSLQNLAQQVQSWNATYILDIPAPFVAADYNKFLELKSKINTYFKNL
jgi:hypothetical protein